MSILDVIKGKAEVPQLGQTQAVQRLATAKTGKAAEGPALSSQQENLAAAQNIAALDQQVGAEQSQFRELEEQENLLKQRAEQTSAKMTEQALNISQQMQQNATKLMDSFQKDVGQLNLARNKAKVEQLGFNLRLSNQQYVDKLKAAGRKARLDSQLSFAEAAAATVFADEMELFQNDLKFRSLLKASDREFERELASIDIESALQIASADRDAANQRLIWQGVGGFAQAGVDAYSRYKAPAKTLDSSKTSNSGLSPLTNYYGRQDPNTWGGLGE